MSDRSNDNASLTNEARSTETATFKEYIKSKEFLFTIGGVFGVGFILVILLFYVFLPVITKHNEWATVPKVSPTSAQKTYKIDDAIKIINDAGLNPVVQDSQYDPTFPPLAVIRQEPQGLCQVKPGRTVYLVVNRKTPPKVKLPELAGASLQQGRYMLESWGLKMGKVQYVAGEGRDVIVHAYYNGAEIKANEALPKGAQIDVAITQGHASYKVAMPDLIGLPLEEAVSKLNEYGLSVGGIRYKNHPDYPEPGKVVDQAPRHGKVDSIDAATPVLIFVSGSEPPHVNEGVELNRDRKEEEKKEKKDKEESSDKASDNQDKKGKTKVEPKKDKKNN